MTCEVLQKKKKPEKLFSSLITGFHVAKGTMVLFNNYHLNTSTEFWKMPDTFYPRHFLSESAEENGNENEEPRYRLKKPEAFFPFSYGKRSCLGQKLVKYMSVIFTANLVRDFEIRPLHTANEQLIRKQLSSKCLALRPSNCFELKLVRR